MEWQEFYKEWNQYETLDQQLREKLALLSDSELEDAFGQALSFGTAGMRGIMGPGINRINIYTVRQATEGLAQLIIEKGPEAIKQGVVIAYDSRNMSKEFALEAALVLGNHQIKTYIFESLRPTPVLSYAVRKLKTEAGIMITASHNPAEYNGYKVYGDDGGQMPPEQADKLTSYVRSIKNPLEVKIGDEKELFESGIIQWVGDDIDQNYLKEVQTVVINSKLNQEMSKNVNIVYTPLHGTGLYLGLKALDNAGYNHIHVVESQAIEDGNFPTVKSPNPESIEAFELAQELGKQVDADILLATDPDADRLGAMIKNNDGTYSLLTGNQIGCLMLDYILNALEQQEALPQNAVCVKSIVSTDLAQKIAENHHCEVIEVLTGFKFIAEKIKEYETTKEHTFILGFEESYGYLIKPFTRDKDAIQALVLLSELTAYHKKSGRTLAQAMEAIYQEYGYYIEKTQSIVYPGLAGQELMENFMEDIRKKSIDLFPELQVDCVIDYQLEKVTFHDGRTETSGLPTANVIKYLLKDGSWITFRPSGTEPKLKVYFSVSGSTKKATEAKLDQLEKEIQVLIK